MLAVDREHLPGDVEQPISERAGAPGRSEISVSWRTACAQFWDVLRGRMSFIGPRPEDPRFVALHFSDYQHILTVRPGIIGLSQLAYEAETQIVSDQSPIEDYVARIMPQKLILDRLYTPPARACAWTSRC